MSTRENSIQSRIADAIRTRYHGHCVVYVNHGNVFSVVGRPDVDGCVWGHHFGFEVKNESNQLSKIQNFRLRELEKAGGIVGGVRSQAEALAVLDRGLAHLERPGFTP